VTGRRRVSGFARWPIRWSPLTPKSAACPVMRWATSSAWKWPNTSRLRSAANRGLMYRVFGEIADPPDQTGMVPAVVNSLAGRLRIAPREVKRRMKVAARIRPRTERPAAATATAPCGRRGAGREDREDHLRVISWAMRWSAAWCARRPRTMPTSFRPRPGVSMRSSTPTGISTKKTGPAAAA